MDPNEALEQIRRQMNGIAHEINVDGGPSGQTTTHLLDLFDGLDTWLCDGGFLPDAWQRQQ